MDLPRETCEASLEATRRKGLKDQQWSLTAWQESAEGIVGAGGTEGLNGVKWPVGVASWERYARQPTNPIGL